MFAACEDETHLGSPLVVCIAQMADVYLRAE